MCLCGQILLKFSRPCHDELKSIPYSVTEVICTLILFRELYFLVRNDLALKSSRTYCSTSSTELTHLHYNRLQLFLSYQLIVDTDQIENNMCHSYVL